MSTKRTALLLAAVAIAAPLFAGPKLMRRAAS